MYLLCIKNKITQKLSKRSKNLGCSKIFPMGFSQKGLSKSRIFLSFLTLILNAFFSLLFYFSPCTNYSEVRKGVEIGGWGEGAVLKIPQRFSLSPLTTKPLTT